MQLKNILYSLSFSILAISCASEQGENTDTSEDQNKHTGINLANMDVSVRPQDDFFYVCERHLGGKYSNTGRPGFMGFF